MLFTWDPDKSDSNKIKHGIDFEQAKEVFEDENAIVDAGNSADGEERWIAIGKTLKLFLVAVVFTIRHATIRIISARQARKNETKAYLNHALNEDFNGESNANR